MAQQIVFTAARAGGARLLLDDELAKGLDGMLRESVVAELRQVMSGGGAVLTTTHDVAVARTPGRQVLVMRIGNLVERGAAEALLHDV